MTQEDFNKAIFEYLIDNVYIDEEKLWNSDQTKIWLMLKNPEPYHSAAVLGTFIIENPAPHNAQGYWGDD